MVASTPHEGFDHLEKTQGLQRLRWLADGDRPRLASGNIAVRRFDFGDPRRRLTGLICERADILPKDGDKLVCADTVGVEPLRKQPFFGKWSLFPPARELAFSTFEVDTALPGVSPSCSTRSQRVRARNQAAGGNDWLFMTARGST